MFTSRLTAIINGAFKFRVYAHAWGFARKGRANAVVLGDDGRYWVVTFGQAQELARRGYPVEYRPR